MTKLLQQCFLFFIVVVILGNNLGNSQVSVYRTVGPILVFLVLVRGYGCSISHNLIPYTTSCKLSTDLVTHSLAYKNKELFKTVYDI